MIPKVHRALPLFALLASALGCDRPSHPAAASTAAPSASVPSASAQTASPPTRGAACEGCVFIPLGIYKPRGCIRMRDPGGRVIGDDAPWPTAFPVGYESERCASACCAEQTQRPDAGLSDGKE